MNQSNHMNAYPEITPAEASELISIVRDACTPGTLQERIEEVRELLELRIVTCNRYLRMLSEWASRGLIIEAASVNESYPELCKVAFQLNMNEGRLEWDQACNMAGISVNSRIDERAFVALSDAVGDASSLDELVQRFQTSVLARQSLANRMQQLQTLLAAAPRNPALKQLAKRYETEALAALESTCRAASMRGEHQTLVDALDAIEGLGWQSQLSAEFYDWLQSEISRERRREAAELYAKLATRIEAAYARRDLMLVGSLSEEVDAVERERRCSPGDKFRERTKEAIEWAETELARLRVEAAHNNACTELRLGLDRKTSQLELSRLRSAVESYGIGIPQDLAERFVRVQSAAITRRRIIIGLIIAAVLVAIAAAITTFSISMAAAKKQAEVAVMAADVQGLSKAGDLAGAKNRLAAIKSTTPWALTYPVMVEAERVVAQAELANSARRAEVRRLLESTVAASKDPATDDASLTALKKSIRDALSVNSDSTAKLAPTERTEAEELLKTVEAEEVKRIADRRRPITEELETLKRDADALGAPVGAAGSEQSISWMSQANAIRKRCDDFVRKIPANYPERQVATDVSARLGEQVGAIERTTLAIATAESALARLSKTPTSEEEFSKRITELLAQPETLKALGLPTAELDETRDMAQVALALQHWREVVLGGLATSAKSSGIAIPASSQDAATFRKSLEAHLHSFPTSPYTSAATGCIAMCETISANDGVLVGLSALAQLKDTGLLSIQQLSLTKNRWAFMRDGGPGTGSLAGLLFSCKDLTVPLTELKANIEVRSGDVNGTARREAPPWCDAFTQATPAFGSSDAIVAQNAWLGAIESARMSVKSKTKATEILGLANFIVHALQVFVEKLSFPEGIDQSLCGKLESVVHSPEALKLTEADWVALSLSKADPKAERENLRRSAQLFLDSIPDLKAAAQSRSAQWAEISKSARATTIAGLLLPKVPGEARRRASESNLNGRFMLLEHDIAGGAWSLKPIRLEGGTLAEGGSSGPSYSFIYRVD